VILPTGDEEPGAGVADPAGAGPGAAGGRDGGVATDDQLDRERPVYPVAAAGDRAAWGHNGAFPGYYSNAFTTRGGGGRQVIVLINANETPLTTQQNTDLAAAVLAGLCGHP
jgi:hypothetical protein